MSAAMLAPGAYVSPQAWRSGVHVGLVVAINDPERRGRVQVTLPAIDPVGAAPVWARVAVAYAGDHYGAFLIPDVGTEVLVAFTASDTGWPVVIGSLWNGATTPPEDLPGDHVDRWTLTGHQGTRIAIVEQDAGQEKVEITTPQGVEAMLTDAGGGEIVLTAAGNTVRLSQSGVSVETTRQVQVRASRVAVTAGQVTVDAGMSSFSGVVRCDTLIASSVVSSSYTPGAGNVW